MHVENTDAQGAGSFSRRTVAKGIAWAAPAVMIAGAAPAFASSIRKDPGINGWVLNTRTGGNNCGYNLEVNSYRPGETGPDGSPFGLYIYDIEDDGALITNATLTYWILGSQSNVVISNASNHSSAWAYDGSVGTEVKPDGMTYTGYRWKYTQAIDASQRPTGPDGVPRVWLGHFHVNIAFTQQRVGSWPFSRCEYVTYWTQREVTIDRDGLEPRYEAEYFTFQRRNGHHGPYTQGARMQAMGTAESLEQAPEGIDPDNVPVPGAEDLPTHVGAS